MQVPPITVEEELSFRLASIRRLRLADRDRIADLAATADLDALAREFDQRRLLSLLGSRLTELVPAAAASPQLSGRVEAAKVMTRRSHALHAHLARSYSRRLEQEGVRTLSLKGPMLAERIYADPGMRTVPTDLDFLVRADDLNRAVSFFSDLGFEVHDDTIWADGLPHYHYGLNPPGSHLPKVELHWRVHWYEAEYAERVLDRSTLDAEGVRRAVPVDDLAMLLIIFARDGFMGLRLAADIAAWWDAQGHLLAPGELGAVMRESPRLSQALLAALTVAERTVGLPSGELGIAEQRLDRRAGRAVRLANWRMLGSPEQLATNITLVDLLLTPRGARRVFWRHYYAQPLGEYVRTYGWPPAARVRNHLRRAVHVAARGLRSSVLYLARLWSIRGGRRYDAFP